MKPFCLGFAALLALWCCGVAAATWQLAEHGSSRYDILLPPSPDARDRRAADELKHYLDAITGGDFAIVSERGAKPVIQLAGATDNLGKAGLAIRPGADGDIVLEGGSQRGSLAPAYRLLDLAGVRWWTPGAETVPHQPDLTLNAEELEEIPVFPDMRDPQTALANDPDWTLRNQGNGIYSGVPVELGDFFRFASYNGRWWMGHTYESILPATKENFAAHPEAFMMLEDGTRSPLQLCPSSPLVRQMAAEAVIAAMKGDPKGEITLAQSDIPICCYCPSCKAAVAREETEAAPHLELVNYVARAVRDAGITDRNIVFLGYQRTRKPPKQLKMEPNTTLWLCTDIQSHAKHLPIRDNAEFVANLKQWRRCVSRIYIWDYYVNFNNFLNYEPSVYSMSDNLKFYRDHGVTGVMLQGDLQSKGGAMQPLYTWVLERLLWNPDLDPVVLIDEFCAGYYGRAGEPMARLYRAVYEYGKAGRQAPEDYRAFDKFEHDCLTEAYRLAGDDPTLIDRLEVAELPSLVRAVNGASMAACRAGKPYDAELQSQLTRLADLVQRHQAWNFSEGGATTAWIERIRDREKLDLAPNCREVDGVTVWKLSSLWKFRALNLITTKEEIAREIAAGVVDHFDDSGWNDYIDCLGIGWEEQGFPGFNGYGIFRNRFELPATLDRKYYYILVGSADEEARVYLNGKPAVTHTIESTGLSIFNIWNHPFGAEVKSLLRPGWNTIAMDVFDSAQMGGLYMPVWVIGSDRELSRSEWWKLSGAVHPYGLDGGDEIWQNAQH